MLSRRTQSGAASNERQAADIEYFVDTRSVQNGTQNCERRTTADIVDGSARRIRRASEPAFGGGGWPGLWDRCSGAVTRVVLCDLHEGARRRISDWVELGGDYEKAGPSGISRSMSWSTSLRSSTAAAAFSSMCRPLRLPAIAASTPG